MVILLLFIALLFINKTLNERFCSEACSFLNDLFIKRSAINNNNNTTTHFIGPHTPIHAILFKYDELLKHISSLHSDKFSSILSFYEKSFSKLYLHEFKQYFQYIKTTISKETYASNNNTTMANFTTVNLLHLINNHDIELSQSTASTIFSEDRMADKNLTKDANRSMPIINESESDDTKKNIGQLWSLMKNYRECWFLHCVSLFFFDIMGHYGPLVGDYYGPLVDGYYGSLVGGYYNPLGSCHYGAIYYCSLAGYYQALGYCSSQGIFHYFLDIFCGENPFFEMLQFIFCTHTNIKIYNI